MPDEATTLTAAISTEGLHLIEEIMAESAVLKRLKEAGHKTSRSAVWKASLLHVLENLDILEKHPMLLVKAGNFASMDFALKKILAEDVEK